MKTVINWFGNNPKIVAVALICLTVGMIAAMYFGYDLSWFPQLVRAMWGGK